LNLYRSKSLKLLQSHFLSLYITLEFSNTTKWQKKQKMIYRSQISMMDNLTDCKIKYQGHSLSDSKKLDQGSSNSLKLGNLVYHSKSIIKHVFFCFGQKIFCRFYEFLKNFGLAQKNLNITLLAVTCK
jgi:hypothetical protein